MSWNQEGPQVEARDGIRRSCDLLVIATGVNSGALRQLELAGVRYRPPKSTKAYICEIYLGRNMVNRHPGSSMHIFLLDLPRVWSAALEPKSDYVTGRLLGEEIDESLVKTFLDAPEVRSCMPPLWRPPKEYCRCSPRINIGSAAQPFGDRVVFIGDCATSKLRKDGIGVACRTATVAANTALFWGVAKEDSRTHDQPGCKKIESDNVIARLLRAITSQIRIRCYARRAVGEVQVYTLEHDSLFRRIQDPFLAFKLIQQMSYRSRQLKTTLVRETKLAM